MKIFALVLAAMTFVGLASNARADELPYFGAEPINGSYWNSPNADYPRPAIWGWSNTAYNSYAQASCRLVRVRHVATGGQVYHRTRRVCY